MNTRACLALLALLSLLGAARADIDPLTGIDMIAVRDTNNRPYNRIDNNNLVTGRGGVSYEYRIGRDELTTAQWMEFYNTFRTRVSQDILPNPVVWGAGWIPAQQRFGLVSPQAANFAVAVDWRTTAMLCNWYHNGKSTALSAIMSGAYDVSTFGYTPDGRFTDQEAHSPGARYWIPTLDEWLKAAFYDPARVNENGTVGGWWLKPNRSDTPLIDGPPGVGDTNSGFDTPSPFTIPLGSYPQTHSYYGMLDASGFTREWSESIRGETTGPLNRYVCGGGWTSFDQPGDWPFDLGSFFPDDYTQFAGSRIASVIPATPPFISILVGCTLAVLRRERRQHHETNESVCGGCMARRRRRNVWHHASSGGGQSEHGASR